jgi:acetyltransferase
MESIGDARAFMSAARETALSKPIIVVKAGRTEEAARAAASQSLLAGTVVSAATLALPVLAATDQVSLEWRAGELGALLGALTPGARAADQNSTS